MRPLACIVAEGLLDTDFDIKDDDVMPGVKNWPRFMGRLQSVGKYHQQIKVSQEFLGKGRTTTRYIWDGVDLLQALTEGINKDIGGRKIGKNKAWDAAIDSEQCILAMFNDPWKPYSSRIYVGTGEEALLIKADERGSSPIVYVEVIKYLITQMQTIEPRNWTIRLVPLLAYDIIKHELGLL